MCNVEIKTCVPGEAVCEPACADHDVCAGQACEARYESIAITKPDNGKAGSSAVVEASLSVKAGLLRKDPPQLALKVNGAPTGTLDLVSPGVYRGVWDPPASGSYQLVVSYDAANLASPPLAVTVDLTPPGFTITVPNPVRNMVPNRFEPSGWRRHETAVVRVSSLDDDVDPASVQLTVRGVVGTSPGRTEAPVPVQQVSSTMCGSASFCGQVSVELWRPEMVAFTGDFGLTVTGKDTSENGAQATATVSVTRHKWSYNTGSVIDASPAVGHSGTVYVGTDSGATSFFALNPDGTLKWPALSLGPITTSPSVGVARSGPSELIYVGSSSDKPFSAVDGASGQVVSFCEPSNASVNVASSLSVVTMAGPGGAGSFETMVGQFKQGSDTYLVAFRPDASSPNDTCVYPLTSIADYNAQGNLIGRNNEFYYGDAGTLSHSVQAFVFDGSTWNVRPSWPMPTGSFLVRGLAFAGSTDLVGGTYNPTATPDDGTFFRALVDGSPSPSINWVHPNTNPPPDEPPPSEGLPVWGPSVAPDNVLLGGIATNRVMRVKVGEAQSTTVAVAGSGLVHGAPLVASDGMAYLATTGGQIAAWVPTKTSFDWSETGSMGGQTIGNIGAATNIDCARDGSGGKVQGPSTLYVPSRNGNLHAIAVDSKGIHTSAPWPKYQRDPRNTGNTATSLDEFACP
jgi:hypothetical protein